MSPGRRHGMERYLVADAECNETIQPGKRCVARGPVDDITFPEKKAGEISAVLPGYTGDKRYLARSRHHLKPRDRWQLLFKGLTSALLAMAQRQQLRSRSQRKQLRLLKRERRRSTASQQARKSLPFMQIWGQLC
jgi:hypothetical protein